MVLQNDFANWKIISANLRRQKLL